MKKTVKILANKIICYMKQQMNIYHIQKLYLHQKITTNFTSIWIKKCLKNEYLAYDTTSISSYSETMDQIKYGHNTIYF